MDDATIFIRDIRLRDHRAACRKPLGDMAFDAATALWRADIFVEHLFRTRLDPIRVSQLLRCFPHTKLLLLQLFS